MSRNSLPIFSPSKRSIVSMSPETIRSLYLSGGRGKREEGEEGDGAGRQRKEGEEGEEREEGDGAGRQRKDGFRSLLMKPRSKAFSKLARIWLAATPISGWLGDSTVAVPTMMQPGRFGGLV